ncbi:MAG: NUDIX domain-containing protein [Thermomicrobium sp.]|nr:NUDIX domain-containing protein [Thermomicrobium sp.]
MTRPDVLAVFTVTLLFAGDRCSVLERSPQRSRLPGQWTGIGGRVDPQEYGALAAAARRELAEEIGLPPEAIPSLVLRRVLLQHRPSSAELTVLLYYTGELSATFPVPPSPEGTVHWVDPATLASLPLVDNARLVLPLLVHDRERDPHGHEPVKLGVARCDASGRVVGVLWDGDAD